VAISPLAWGASQPAAESVVAALHGGEYDTGLDLDTMWDVQHDVEELKRRHLEHLLGGLARGHLGARLEAHHSSN